MCFFRSPWSVSPPAVSPRSRASRALTRLPPHLSLARLDPMVFGRGRPSAETANGAKTPSSSSTGKSLSTSAKEQERAILAAMTDSDSEDETARVVARETLSSIPPTALSWGNEDEDDVTRAATAATPSANQAGTSRPSAGGWAKRFGGTKEKETKKKAASVANMSRAEKRAANGYEKQHTKDAKEMNVTCATNAARKESRESQETHEIQPCAIDATTFGAPARRAETTRSSSRSVSFSFLVVLVFKILVAAIVAFALFLAAVYLDSNFPEAWPEMWRLEQHVNNLSASEALAFALGVVQDLVGETKKAVTAATALAIREKNALAVALTKKTVSAIAKLRAESEFVTAHVTRFATSAGLVFADRVRTAKTLFDEAKAFASRKAGR